MADAVETTHRELIGDLCAVAVDEKQRTRKVELPDGNQQLVDDVLRAVELDHHAVEVAHKCAVYGAFAFGNWRWWHKVGGLDEDDDVAILGCAHVRNGHLVEARERGLQGSVL